MSVWSKTVMIDAPIDKVFEAVSTPEIFHKAVPQIIDIEYLTEQKTGIGTKFKETRIMNKRKASTVLEIVDQEKNSHIRMISNAAGTEWDSTFSTEEEEDGVQLRLVMTAVPNNFLARLTLKMMKGMVSTALEKDMDAIKNYCEGNS